MSRILTFTSGPRDWRAFLADPEKQWRAGKSARALAHSWEAAEGLPREIAEAFEKCTDPLLAELSPVLAVPEFKVHLPGATRASQNDIFVLARSARGPVSIMAEGKVDESFGPTLEEWRRVPSSGKDERLRYLVRVLGLDAEPPGATRYQLLHRAASAIITGEQYHAVAAVVLIHSFSRERTGWADYASFARLFGVEAAEGEVQRLGNGSSLPLFGAWIVGDEAFLRE
jgi:hypothetical protein